MKKTTIIIFCTILVSVMLMNIVFKDSLVSYSERRKLDQFPEFSVERLFNGEFMSDFEEYVLDQFAFREFFRSVKAESELNLLMKKDVNDIYLYDGHLIKFLYPYREDSVYTFSHYIQKVIDEYNINGDIYYSIIPDKNYFVEDGSYPKIDYSDMEAIINKELDNLNYIDIMDILSLDDYYKTDTHWNQKQLLPVLQAMKDAMGMESEFLISDYNPVEIEEFLGVYYGQAALSIPSEVLTYLESEAMKDVTIVNYQYLDELLEVYDRSKIGGMDDYDVFLSGASPLIEIVNEKALTDKEIIIFRDSFGSSLAPLLIDEYAKITLVDTRYVSYKYLGQFIEFDNQEILFMYNTAVINNSLMLK